MPGTDERARSVPVVIVGAGFAGIGFATRLRAAGITDFEILERSQTLGGTWRDNRYPGCGCDVPSLLYSYSFAPRSDWSRTFARQEEILEYLRVVATEHDVVSHIRFGVELERATWDEVRRVWNLDTSTGPMRASVLIAATGLFGGPIIPAVRGLQRFGGVSFHSVGWDDRYDLSGKRVAVIGTGASAIQFVPQIQPAVSRLTVFQRTPPWILPKPDRAISPIESTLLRVTGLNRLLRNAFYVLFEATGAPSLIDPRLGTVPELAGRLWLRHQVKDRSLRAALTPTYRLGCKRVLFSNDYLRALCADNVELVTHPITEIDEHGVLTASGHAYDVDAIIFGTGFTVPTETGELFVGRDGRTLADVYRERPQSFLGTTYAGFPNLFQFFGPFSAAGNQSAIYMLEAQFAYVLDALRLMRRTGMGSLEVTNAAQQAFTDEMEARSTGTVWQTGGCVSYYQTEDGRNGGLWPDWSFAFRRRMAHFDTEPYLLTQSPNTVPAVSTADAR